MKGVVRTISIIGILSTTSLLLLSQEFPVLKRVQLIVSVSKASNNPFFLYTYTMSNERENSASIWVLEIDITAPQSLAIDTSGLKFGDEFTEETFREAYARFGTGIVPVGIPSRPTFWTPGISNGKKIDWASGQGYLLDPGKNISGFVLQSKGLPAIREFRVHGYLSIDFFPSVNDLSPEQADSLLHIIDSVRTSLTISGITVGPQIPPEPFIAIAFLDTLISYKHQAFDLGWIKNRGIVQSLDAKLDNAKRQLQRNNKTAAKNMLQAFINEVEALWKEENQRRNLQGVQITSEAYALLKFNAEYLISKL